MSKILITGVAGLVGSHLSRYLISKGHTIIGVDNLFGGYISFVDRDVKFYKADLGDLKNLYEIFEVEKPDYVFHLAAYAAVGLSPFIRNFNYQNNLICSVNVINSCIKYNVAKIIFASSMDVYGYGKPPYDENQTPSPISPYGIAKYAVEQDLKQAHDQFGLRYSIIRPHNIVGIYQNIWDKYRNVIGIWIRQILKGEPISIFGDGTQRRAFSDIQYYMDPFNQLMDNHDNEIFNIGADKDYSIIYVANVLKVIAQKYDFKCEIKHYEARHEVKEAYCNHDKAKSLLGFEDNTILEDMIEKMFLWAKTQPERQVKKWNMKLIMEFILFGNENNK